MKVARLGDIVNNLDSLRIPLNEQERKKMQTQKLYPYVGANNILDYINDYIFDEKILCVAEDGGSWGFNEKCSFVLNEKCWVNNHAHVLTAKNGTSLEYLKYYLNRTNLNKYITGSTRGKLNKSSLNEIKIPLPPLSTQQQIARILDQADALRKKTQQVIDLYDQLAQSIFLDMFGDPVRNPKGFSKGVIRDLVSEVKYGTSSKSDSEGDYAYLRMNNITYSGHMNFTDLKYICLDQKELSKYSVKKGDLLFNRTNSKELVGKTAVYNRDDMMVIAGYIIRVRMNESGNPHYVWGYLNSRHGKLVLKNMCKNIVGMANINAQELQDIKILIPPITLQNQFAEKISLIEKQKELAKQSLQESENLFNSLLQKAFKGELVNSV
ncbi:MAG: restriction endonuclease subunit S [Bacteroidales bacterium]